MTEQSYNNDEDLVYDGVAILLAGVVDYLIENASERVSIKHFTKDFSSKNVKVEYDADDECFVFSMEDLESIDEESE